LIWKGGKVWYGKGWGKVLYGKGVKVWYGKEGKVCVWFMGLLVVVVAWVWLHNSY
jgi:hypothetical protein